jgi:RNA polymerase sigma-70 factor (ECF subfamily)
MGTFLQTLFLGSDEQAMWRVRTQGDPQAFARLVGRWERPLQRLCARLTGDPHRAEDLAQETFARVFARRAHYEPSGRFSTFLWRIAMNLCHDEQRRIKRRGEVPLDESGDSDGPALDELLADVPAPDRQLADADSAEHVRRALSRLPESHRVVVVLRHYEGLKFREIADVLEIPEGTVKSRMAEALSQLHRLLHHLNEECDVSCKPRSKPPILTTL